MIIWCLDCLYRLRITGNGFIKLIIKFIKFWLIRTKDLDYKLFVCKTFVLRCREIPRFLNLSTKWTRITLKINDSYYTSMKNGKSLIHKSLIVYSSDLSFNLLIEFSRTIVTLRAIAIGVAKLQARNQIPAIIILAVSLLGLALLNVKHQVTRDKREKKKYK